MTEKQYITPEQQQAIRAIPHFARGVYRDIDLNGAIDFYTRRYVGPLGAFTDLGPDDAVADIGTGYGWLAIAFALRRRARVIAVDMDEARLDAARRIAEILGVGDRIDWRVGMLGRLPLADGEARVTYCIEVIEHIGRARPALRDLARVSAETLVVTTPNLYFPVIAHDTGLPFCHWLPLAWRAALCRALRADGSRERQSLLVAAEPARRARRLRGCLALSPLQIAPRLRGHLPHLCALCRRWGETARWTAEIALLSRRRFARAPLPLRHALARLHAPPARLT